MFNSILTKYADIYIIFRRIDNIWWEETFCCFVLPQVPEAALIRSELSRMFTQNEKFVLDEIWMQVNN